MSKVLSEWDERHGLENCNSATIYNLYKTLLVSPHENGLMPVSSMDNLDKTHYVPFEEMILFGLEGANVEKYPEAEA